MSYREQYEDEDFQQSGGGWWIKWIGIIVYTAIIVAYAVQTLELVAWLFPADTWFMKTVTVFVCDGCATGYAMAEMFYRFRLRKSKTVVFGMWIVTFALSTAATVIQMYLSSTHNVPHAIDPTVISIAYGLIILAFVVNIVAITLVIRMEHGASHPQHRYLDDKPATRKVVPNATPVPSDGVTQGKQQERMYDADEVKQMITESVNRVADYYLQEQDKMREKVAEREKQNPLAQSRLNPSSQNGTENGHNH